MPIRGFFLLSFFVASLPSWADPLCVQTFNAYGPAYAKDVAPRTERLVNLIRDEGQPACDLIQLQEVWTNSQLGILKQGFLECSNVQLTEELLELGLVDRQLASLRRQMARLGVSAW